MRAIHLTITQRLWLGLGLIVALFAAANLVSLRASHELDATLAGLVDNGDARSAAAYEMKINLEELVRAAEDYLEQQDPRQRARLRDAQNGFERALAQYRDLSSGERSRELARHAAERYADVNGGAQDLIHLATEKAHRLTELTAHQRRVHSLLRSMPQAARPGREPEPVAKRTTVKRLREALLLCARPLELLLTKPARNARDRLVAERQRLAAALSRYGSVAPSTEEREWAREVVQWHEQGLVQAEAILEAGPVAQRGLAKLVRAKDALDTLLDERLQPAAKAELAAALDSASDTAHRANGLMTRGLLLALLLGALAALATSRAVKAPLRALVASSRRFAEGDFSYRVPTDSRDELGELTTALNEMAARLQATTVSRSYMESVVNSMGEALLVVSADGAIETVNPAAEKLLGRQPGELTGQPFNTILEDGAALGAAGVPAPSRFHAHFRAQDGSPVPVAVSAVPMQTQSGSSRAVVCIAQDLRERLAAERDQRQAAVVFDNTREGILLTDAQRNIVLANPAFTEITGYELHEVKGRLVRLLWSKRHDTAFCSALWRTVEDQGQWQGEIWMRRKGGELRPVWKNISVVRDASGQVVNHVAVFSDITALKDAEQRLHYLAYHDPLTDLPNRSLLADRLRAAISRGERLGSSVALLYLDLDNFKHVNDTLGHEEGDRLLQSMAARLQACVRGKDSVARLGGDEFIVVLEDVTGGAKEAARVAEKILGAMSAPFDLSGFELRMRASIGISLWPQHGQTGEELLKAADAAMYRAKASGRGKYEFFSPDLTRQALERLTLENALRSPKLQEQLVLHYQPQFSVRNGSIVGVEALIRWQHPARGMLSPQAFVPMAEEAGLIHGIGEWVLRTACAQAGQWIESGHPAVRMAVNVSAYQIRDDRIVGIVEAALEQTGLNPSLLELEVTEGALQTGAEATEILGRLKRLGVRLALDDFGTGYSALSSLKLLPFDRLKIDRSFIRDLEQDPDDRALAVAIIAMGRSLGLEIVAEGVETAAQLAFLRKQGCDEMQGYLLGPPVAARELEATLRGLVRARAR